MKYVVPNPTRLSLQISDENRRKLDRASFDLKQRHGISVPVAYLIDRVLNAADLKQLAAEIGETA